MFQVGLMLVFMLIAVGFIFYVASSGTEANRAPQKKKSDNSAGGETPQEKDAA